MHIAAEGPLEIEVKLRVSNTQDALQRLQACGFIRSRDRVFEENTLYDTPESSLRSRGVTLRLRRAGGICTMTQKGPSEVVDGHKVRVENETEVADFDAAGRILHAIGYLPSFHYEKRRTEFRIPSEPGLAVLDETPIGIFLELEGESAWIDGAAGKLGFSTVDYITKSYPTLFEEYRTANGPEQDGPAV